jgi:hypothetical protein
MMKINHSNEGSEGFGIWHDDTTNPSVAYREGYGSFDVQQLAQVFTPNEVVDSWEGKIDDLGLKPPKIALVTDTFITGI